jgi:prepilin-type N-terminal cleavage/methylation domain-containing protein
LTCRPANPRPRAFTLIEVLVVVVILVVLAGALVPRLASMGGREVRASAVAVGDLVSVAARRDALTSQRVALQFDADSGSLALMTMQTSSRDTGAPMTPEWHQDRLMPRVQLGDTIMQASTDGVALDAKGWRVEFPQGGRRPALAIVLSDGAGKEHWRVDLPSIAAHAVVSSGNAQGMSDQTVDLDATGGGTAPW